MSSRFSLVVLVCLLAGLACTQSGDPADYNRITPVTAEAAALATPTANVPQPTGPVPGLPTATRWPTLNVAASPTPDVARPSLLDRTTVENYTVLRGDTLRHIGERYGVTAQAIAEANGLTLADVLQVGQALLIPPPVAENYGPDFKILPDSEMVYGPSTATFNLNGYLQAQGGYLANYTEEVSGAYLDGTMDSAKLTGSQIVQLVAVRYSVHPRLLLALLEYQSGWVTKARPGDTTLVYPLRRVEVGREGLLRQLSWAANQLNLGYYTWRVGGLLAFSFPDGSIRLINSGLNAGTVGVQRYLAQGLGPKEWSAAVAPDGFSRLYRLMFGNPFALAYEPLVPPDLQQPAWQLPFEADKVWAFTSGPHAAWDSGSAWGALDFAPPAEAPGCVTSAEWVTAAADGVVVRSQYGAVIEDLDGDGYEGTGWNLFYLHLELRDRVAGGTWVKAGDRLGHPSCEGGISNGTHVHLARKYNGEWLSADGALPFELDGWVSAGLGQEYDGTLTKADLYLEACDCRASGNEISRP